jgi:hypothetical protein
MFTNSKEFNELNNNNRSEYFFMLNRTASVKFPVFAEKYNHQDINTGQVVNSWHDIFKKINGTPSWVWNISKGLKKANKVKKSKYKPTEEVINKFCDINKIGIKELQRYEELYPDEYIAEIKDFETCLDPDIKTLK